MKSWHRISLWLLASVLFSSGCQRISSTPTASGVPIAPPTAVLATTNVSTPTPLPTPIPSITPAPPTLTPSGMQVPSKVLALSYCPQANDVTCDIWLLQPSNQTVQPFRLHDTQYAYCCPQWSLDGQKITYVRIHITAPLSASLWISRPDGSEERQIEDETQEGLLPVGWSTDGQAVMFFKGDNLYQTDVQSGKELLIDLLPRLASLKVGTVSVYSQLLRFYTANNQLLLYGQKDDHLVYIVANLKTLDKTMLLTPPDDYTPVGQGRAEVSLSPDGHFLLVADFERHSVKERLWLVDVFTNEWRLVVSRSVEYAPDSVAWSSDQRWAAWWRANKDLQGNYYVFITFLDTTSWNITREYKFSGTPAFVRNGIIGWATDSQGNSGFAILENKPGRGIVLLKPDGSGDDDLELVGYDQLAQQLPFKPEDAEWVWQP